MTAQDVLLLLSLGIIVLWTTRLARSKGLNPWAWGVGSILLIALAWNFSPRFLGPVVMAPLIFLLLFRSPIFRRGRKAVSMPCPSCGAPETGGLNFCVQCGWDLARSAPEDSQGIQEPFSSATFTEDAARPERASEERASEPVTGQPSGQSSWAPAGEPPQAKDGAPAEQPSEVSGAGAESLDGPATGPISEPAPELARKTEPEPVADTAPGPVAEPVLAQESNAQPLADSGSGPVGEPVSEPPPPVESPAAPRPLPTPANLTERGVSLFNQGRFQEAIDQFTKAIALDPDYKEAWERRAEAYGRMGRPERQKADQRRLEAF